MKTLATILATMLSAISTFAYNSFYSYDFKVDGIYYTITSEADKVVCVSCNMTYEGPFLDQVFEHYYGDIVIPTSVVNDGVTYTVTEIGNRAFVGSTELTSITIPEGITSIGNGAFEGCTGLTEVDFPSTVTSIHASAFNGCTGITSIVIPEGVESIDYAVFNECTSLASITIPQSVTYISDHAFADCM